MRSGAAGAGRAGGLHLSDRHERADRHGSSSGPSERAMVQLVSGEFFHVLRQQPQAGRLLSPSDNVTLGAHPVAVISDGYWERQFRRAPGRRRQDHRHQRHDPHDRRRGPAGVLWRDRRAAQSRDLGAADDADRRCDMPRTRATRGRRILASRGRRSARSSGSMSSRGFRTERIAAVGGGDDGALPARLANRSRLLLTQTLCGESRRCASSSSRPSAASPASAPI